MNGMKIPMALIFAVVLQAIGLVWYVSKIDSKVEILYTTFEEENQKEVIENQVKMKLDLENIIADVGELRQVIKKLKNKDADIQKVNKKIIKQHDRLFDLIEGNSSSNSSYSYGD
jgi:cell division protein FtsL